MRLIDAEKLMEDFPIRIHSYDKEHGDLHFVLGIESVMEYINDNMPTIEPVKHGEWISCRKPNRLWDIIVFKCSICGCENYNDSLYCPSCGSKMDGDNNG